jgi:hypothetical protein
MQLDCVSKECCRLLLDDGLIRRCIVQKFGVLPPDPELTRVLAGTCSKHPYFRKAFTCGTCKDDQPVCGLCFVDDHSGHKLLVLVPQQDSEGQQSMPLKGPVVVEHEEKSAADSLRIVASTSPTNSRVAKNVTGEFDTGNHIICCLIIDHPYHRRRRGTGGIVSINFI